MRIASIAAVATLVMGCVTQPVPSSEAKPVPEDRIHAPDFLQAGPGRAYLVVTRDKGLKASLCGMGVYIDGTLVATLRPSEQVRLFVNEGKHLVGVDSQTTACFTDPHQMTVHVTQAEPLLLRISAGGKDGTVIEQSAF